MTDSRIADILRALEVFDGIYKRAEVDAAVERREEITPYLIGILEEVLAAPASYAVNEKYYAHVYALVLLTHFREQRAHRAIVGLAALPPDIPHQLFGDLVTEQLPVTLFRTCGGSPAMIKSLIVNSKADDYCRASAVRAMAFGVAEGMIPREETLALFGSLLTGREAAPSSPFWSFLACSVCDLYPEELMGVIEKAYQDELISPWVIRLDSFERALRDGKETTLERLKREIRRRAPDSVHDYISWWACFEPPEQGLATESPTPVTAGPRGPRAPIPIESVPPKPRVPRNAPCPCGSGRKYKKCCGR